MLLIGIGVIAAVFVDLPTALHTAAVYTVSFLIAGLWRPNDRSLLIAVAMLSAISLSLLHTLEPQLAHRQSQWLFIGSLVYAFVRSAVAGWALQHVTKGFYLSSLALLFTTLFGHLVGGARSWILLAGHSFQPVEFFKVVLVAYWAVQMTRHGKAPLRVFGLPAALTLMNLALLVLQRDLGPVLVLVTTALLWALLVGVPRRHVALAGLGVGAASGVFVYTFPHVAKRFMAWLAPWTDPFGAGYQTLQARFAMAHGQIAGQGWQGGLTELPAAATDLPVVAIIERLGLIGGLMVLVLLAYIVWRILAAALVDSRPLARQLGLGCGLLLGSQAAVAWAGAVGLLPMVGITLPFVSYGGSSLVAVFMLIALANGQSGLTHPRTCDVWSGLVPRARLVVGIIACALAAPMVYWTAIRGPELAAHPRYVAQLTVAAAGTRGGIVSRNGENLTATGLATSREPVLGSLVHTVGYVHPRYGTAGLERTFDGPLSGREHLGVSSRLGVQGQSPSQVHTTIDLGMQSTVEEALGDLGGAVVVLDPWTGAILAMASSPRATVSELAHALEDDENAPLLNRAVQGLYPAGSAFKPVILAAALENGAATPATRWLDQGVTVIDGYRVQNAGGRPLGTLSPQSALAHSSNVVFAQLAALVGSGPIRLQASALGIGQSHDLEIPYRVGNLGGLDSAVHLASVGIGQGELLVTPLEMAVVAASIANGGYRVYPHLVTHLAPSGTGALTLPSQPVRAMSRSTAQLISDAMRQAVAHGTAAGLADPAHLAGKTGTAQNPHGEPHAWFIGFAPAFQPAVAFAILVENGGAGARTAGPIARQIAEYVTANSFQGR